MSVLDAKKTGREGGGRVGWRVIVLVLVLSGSFAGEGRREEEDFFFQEEE